MPLGIAAVMPTMELSFWQSLTIAWPKTSCQLGGVPGLAERLRGVPVDAQALEIKYQVPAESPVKSLAGKEVSLRISIKEVRSRKVPALDDELAKDSGEADTLADLRTKVREKLVEAENQRIKREMSVALGKDIGGQPVVVEIDRSPSPGLQNHWVVLYAKQGNDYLMLAPWPIPADSGPVTLGSRYGFGRQPKEYIVAAVWYLALGSTTPSSAPRRSR